jgi:hypothetical protein
MANEDLKAILVQPARMENPVQKVIRVIRANKVFRVSKVRLAQPVPQAKTAKITFLQKMIRLILLNWY